MPNATVRKMQAKRSIADWLVIRVRVLAFLPRNRRAKMRTARTTALAQVPVTPVTSPITIDAIGNGGGPRNGGRASDTFSAVSSVLL